MVHLRFVGIFVPVMNLSSVFLAFRICSYHDNAYVIILFSNICSSNQSFFGFNGLYCSYHDNAYVTSRALHIVNTVNANATFSLLEGFFKHQVCSMLILKTCPIL